MARVHAIGLALASTLLLAAGGCSNAPADGDCEKLLAHVIDIELTESQVAEGDRAAKGKALRDEIGERFLARCDKELPASQVKCGLKSKSTADMESCDK